MTTAGQKRKSGDREENEDGAGDRSSGGKPKSNARTKHDKHRRGAKHNRTTHEQADVDATSNSKSKQLQNSDATSSSKSTQTPHNGSNAKAASEHTKVGKIINREYEDLGLKPDPEKLHPPVPEPVVKQTWVPRGEDNINVVEEHHYDEQMREVEEKREKVRKTEAAKTVADKLKEVLNTHNNRYATVTKTIHEHESKTQKRLDSIKDERDSFLETYRQQRDQALKSAQESGRKRKDLAEENRDLKSKVKELDGPVREEHRQMKAKDREIAELKKALKDRT